MGLPVRPSGIPVLMTGAEMKTHDPLAPRVSLPGHHSAERSSRSSDLFVIPLPEEFFLVYAPRRQIAFIAERLPAKARIIRAMPNAPALVLAGAAGIAKGEHATAEDLQLAEAIFAAVGKAVVVEEKHLDAVTGLSGSGPAYAFLFIEALADAGVKMGLARDVARLLAAQTVLGAAKMVLESGRHPAELKDMVASPGGTTIAGLHVLERGGLRGTLIEAVEAATIRSRELGRR